MSLSIEGVHVAESPVPDMYLFEFSDGEYVVVQRNMSDRHSKYDGNLYGAWFATDGSIVDSVDEIRVRDVPDKVGDNEIYWRDSQRSGEEYVQLIQDFVQ